MTFPVFQGCYEKVEEWLEDNKHLLGTIGMCILVVQVRLRVLVCFAITQCVKRSGDNERACLVWFC